MILQVLEGIAEAIIGGLIVAGIIYGVNYLKAQSSKNFNIKSTAEAERAKVGASAELGVRATVKVGYPYSRLKVILGLVLIIVGIFCIIYGYQTFGIGFSIKTFSNVTNPIGDFTHAISSSFEGLGLEVLGIILIIAGALLINKESTLKIMQWFNGYYNP